MVKKQSVGGRGRGRGRVKRQQVEVDDGWTVVTHGLSNLSIARGKDQRSKTETTSLPDKIVEGLTAQKLLDSFVKLQERWVDTALARQIEDLRAQTKNDVRNAVCIGIGSFSREWAHRWRSLWQLVLFIAVLEHMKQEKQESSVTKIEVHAQDPAFTALDIEFLGLLGVEVMQSGIEDHICDTSFVYSPFVDWYLLLPTFLPSKNPVLYLGNEILDDYTPYAQSEEKREKLVECNERGKKFLGGREKVRLREFDAHGSALEGIVFYWRTEDDAPREEIIEK